MYLMHFNSFIQWFKNNVNMALQQLIFIVIKKR